MKDLSHVTTLLRFQAGFKVIKFNCYPENVPVTHLHQALFAGTVKPYT